MVQFHEPLVDGTWRGARAQGFENGGGRVFVATAKRRLAIVPGFGDFNFLAYDAQAISQLLMLESAQDVLDAQQIFVAVVGHLLKEAPIRVDPQFVGKFLINQNGMSSSLKQVGEGTGSG